MFGLDMVNPTRIALIVQAAQLLLEAFKLDAGRHVKRDVSYSVLSQSSTNLNAPASANQAAVASLSSSDLACLALSHGVIRRFLTLNPTAPAA